VGAGAPRIWRPGRRAPLHAADRSADRAPLATEESHVGRSTRRSVRAAAAGRVAGLCGRLDSDARPRPRREHRDLLDRARRGAAAAAVSGSRSALCGLLRESDGRSPSGVRLAGRSRRLALAATPDRGPRRLLVRRGIDGHRPDGPRTAAASRRGLFHPRLSHHAWDSARRRPASARRRARLGRSRSASSC
jgi:hypothetical protein